MPFSRPVCILALATTLIMLFPPWHTRDEVARFVGYGPLLLPPTYPTTPEKAAGILGKPAPEPISLPDPPAYDPRLSQTENMMERHRVYNRASAMRLLASMRSEDVPARIAWRILLIELLVVGFVGSVVIGRRQSHSRRANNPAIGYSRIGGRRGDERTQPTR